MRQARKRKIAGFARTNLAGKMKDMVMKAHFRGRLSADFCAEECCEQHKPFISVSCVKNMQRHIREMEKVKRFRRGVKGTAELLVFLL